MQLHTLLQPFQKDVRELTFHALGVNFTSSSIGSSSLNGSGDIACRQLMPPARNVANSGTGLCTLGLQDMHRDKERMRSQQKIRPKKLHTHRIHTEMLFALDL